MSDYGYKRLSAAIVISAFQDAAGVKLHLMGPSTPRHKGMKLSQEARKFIESDGLTLWCSVLDIDPVAIRERLPEDSLTTCSGE